MCTSGGGAPRSAEEPGAAPQPPNNLFTIQQFEEVIVSGPGAFRLRRTQRRATLQMKTKSEHRLQQDFNFPLSGARGV